MLLTRRDRPSKVRPTPMRPAAIFVLIPLLVAACHDDKPKADTKQAASAEPIPSDLVYNSFVTDDQKPTTPMVVVGDGGAAVVQDTGSTAKLVSPGADPKSPIRYAYSTKTRTVDASITISGGGSAGGMPDQPFRFVFTATPKPKSMMGHDATIDVKISKFEITLPPGLPPAQAAQKDQLEKALVGVQGHFDATQFGDVGDVDFKADALPRGASDIVNMMQQIFELLVVPVPNEAVGIGAKWEKSDSKRMADQGASVQLKTTITLVARDAQTATLKVENTASGTMAVNDPRAPKGTTIDRKSTASYDVIVRFDGVAQKSSGQSTTDVTQKVPGQPDQGMSLKMTIGVTSK